MLGVMRRLINKEMGNIKIPKKNWEGDVNEVLIVLAMLKKRKLNILNVLWVLGLSINIRVIKRRGMRCNYV